MLLTPAAHEISIQMRQIYKLPGMTQLSKQIYTNQLFLSKKYDIMTLSAPREASKALRQLQT